MPFSRAQKVSCPSRPALIDLLMVSVPNTSLHSSMNAVTSGMDSRRFLRVMLLFQMCSSTVPAEQKIKGNKNNCVPPVPGVPDELIYAREKICVYEILFAYSRTCARICWNSRNSWNAIDLQRNFSHDCWNSAGTVLERASRSHPFAVIFAIYECFAKLFAATCQPGGIGFVCRFCTDAFIRREQ